MKKGKKDEDNPPLSYLFYFLSFLPIIIFYYYYFFLPFYLFPISYLNPIFRLKLSGFSL